MNTTVRTYLIELARKAAKQQVTYQKLSDDCKLGYQLQDNPVHRMEIASLLDSISRYENSFGRPLLSVLVVKSTDPYPGNGFYKLAETLTGKNLKNSAKKVDFWSDEFKKCITFWKDDKQYLAFRKIVN